jgi:hypothetical protein
LERRERWETGCELCSAAPHPTGEHTGCEAINNLEVENSEKDFDAANGGSDAAVNGQRASSVQ